jgi:WD40 repeat protein
MHDGPTVSGAIVAVGDDIGTVSLFQWDFKSHSLVGTKILKQFRDHTLRVTSVTAHSALDLLVTGAADGVVNVYRLRTLQFQFCCRATRELGVRASMTSSQRDLDPKHYQHQPGRIRDGGAVFSAPQLDLPITWVACSQYGIVFYTSVNTTLHAVSLSGVPLCPPRQLKFTLHCHALSFDGSVLMLGGTGGYIECIDVMTLTTKHFIGNTGAFLSSSKMFDATNAPPPNVEPFAKAVTALSLSDHEQALLVGLDDGEIKLFTLPQTHFVAGKLDALEHLGV